ncbi:MAG: type II toxin-antitoxin system toxin DNA ADP-ribosyl transferase DarT [Candidatus Entotheonellia bacterium]
MSPPPSSPRIYHITHIDNLSSIAACSWLWSDSACMRQDTAHTCVGMTTIKARRLYELEVDCHPGTKVGEYVPFYFCPRSIMLYLLHRGNHPDLNYTGGQRPVVHLAADLHEVVGWAEAQGVRWAFSDRNAGTRYACFCKDLTRLDQIDWDAVAARDFRDPLVKEGKQAEFLVHRAFPWLLVRWIGTCDRRTAERAMQALDGARHQPLVSVEAEWYY